jgi:hypothetical protein
MMRAKGMDFTESMDATDCKVLRQLVIHCILATDLNNHVRDCAEFRKMLGSEGGVNMSEFGQCKLVLGVTVHFADCSNVAKKWSTYKEWIRLLFAEFHGQGDLEAELGMSSAPNNDRSKSVPYKAQQGFINMFALDLFDMYTSFLPDLVRTAVFCFDCYLLLFQPR